MAQKHFKISLSQEPAAGQLGRPPGQLGGSLNKYVPPGAQYDYNPPSVFVRYRALTVIFALLLLAFLGYWVWAPRHARHAPAAQSSNAPASLPQATQAPQAEPVYVEPLPAAK